METSRCDLLTHRTNNGSRSGPLRSLEARTLNPAVENVGLHWMITHLHLRTAIAFESGPPTPITAHLGTVVP